MPEKSANAKLAQIGKCVSEGFTTAVNNGYESLQLLKEMARILRHVELHCPRELFMELRGKYVDVAVLNAKTIACCEEKGIEIERIAHDLAAHETRYA